MATGSPVSIRNEVFAGAEFASLLTDPLYYGIGAPRGDGRLALVLPGLFANDLYLQPLRSWLSRIGFRPVRSTLAVNAGCPERLTNKIQEELERRRRSNDHRVILIGHSRGGILARAIAGRLQDDASHLILLGSPVGVLESSAHWGRGVPQTRTSAAVSDASTRARRTLDPDCDVPDCGCPFPADFRRPLSVHTSVLSIASREDPIVPSSMCRVAGAENIVVSGTHSGLVYNRAVYRALAGALAV
jgi:pimeloyl-ACP methyl ester carboxylesterase